MREGVKREEAALPPGWVWTTLGEVTQPIEKIDPTLEPDSEFTYLDIASIDNAIQRVTDPKRYRGANAPSRARQRVKAGDVLFSTVRTYLKNIALVPEVYNDQVASTGFSILRGNDGVLSRYLFYYCLTDSLLSGLAELQRGTSYPAVRDGDVRTQRIPLAPLPEQHRIVAKIEELFSDLDAGVAALKRVQANLKRYRASVLNAACEGRLVPTEAELAREEGRAYEPADVLLRRILAERRVRWEAEHPGKKYVEPAAPETDGLPELPEGWCWASLGQLGEIIGGLTKNPTRDRLPVRLPYLRVANVYANELRLDDLQSIGVEESEIGRVLLQDGDLLVVEGNGSVDQIGRVAIWRCAVSPCLHQNHIIKIRLDPVDLGPFILHWLLSDGGRAQITQVASSTSGLYTLSLSKVASLLTPLPPLPEQHRIVAEVERRLSVVAELEATVAANLARAGRLRQAVLKRAFEGRLVSQDVLDEPASVLAEQIKAEKQASLPTGSPKKRQTNLQEPLPYDL